MSDAVTGGTGGAEPCKGLLGGNHTDLIVCGVCYRQACEAVAHLRQKLATQSVKMTTYGADLKRRITVLETELSQARQEIAYLRGQ